MPSKASTQWQRVSRRRPCPVCGKPDWCLFNGEPSDPEAVICARTESPKRCGESGWLHVLHREGPTWSPRVRRIELSAARVEAAVLDFERLAAVRSDGLDTLAASLGLSSESLQRLGVGWSQKHRAWTFPMRDAVGKVLGIRLRLPDGRKLSICGGKEGLFIPEGLQPDELLLVAEGPSDTAALLDLGFDAVGRPSCTGGVRLLVELVGKLKPSAVVIVADADPPGRRGAESLVAVLVAYAAAVRIITPPAGIKDARQWKQSGATTADVEAAIDAAPVRRLAIAARLQGKRGGRHER